MMKFIADIVTGRVNYDANRCSFDTFAKVCVYRRAVDLLRKRGGETQREFQFGMATLLRLSQGSPLDDVEFAEAVERAKVALETMPANYAAAITARRRFGRTGYVDALVEEHGVSRALAAQWLHRAMDLLSQATGISIHDDEQRSS